MRMYIEYSNGLTLLTQTAARSILTNDRDYSANSAVGITHYDAKAQYELKDISIRDSMHYYHSSRFRSIGHRSVIEDIHMSYNALSSWSLKKTGCFCERQVAKTNPRLPDTYHDIE